MTVFLSVSCEVASRARALRSSLSSFSLTNLMLVTVSSLIARSPASVSRLSTSISIVSLSPIFSLCFSTPTIRPLMRLGASNSTRSPRTCCKRSKSVGLVVRSTANDLSVLLMGSLEP